MNICLSGGAEGADLQWGMCAGTAGHQVVHWSFKGHKSQAPSSEVVELTNEQLLVADDALVQANKSLHRRFPGNSWFVNSLLRRNYYQVKWTEAVYAVATLKKGMVSGGTAWAVQLYIDRFLIGNEDISKCKLYLYDQLQECWMQWVYEWKKVDEIPIPSGIWTGIGSRELSESGKKAIRRLLGYECS